MPRFLERDEAEREPPCDQYPWDGVRNVRPFSRFKPASSRRLLIAEYDLMICLDRVSTVTR